MKARMSMRGGSLSRKSLCVGGGWLPRRNLCFRGRVAFQKGFVFVGAWLVGFDGMAGVVGAVGARWLRRVGFDGVAFQKGFVF